jgi:hypothetical protein
MDWPAQQFYAACKGSGRPSTEPSRVNGHRFLPTGGHEFPHWWPSFLPAGGHESPHRQGCASESVEGLDSFPGGCLREAVAVLPFGDQDVGVMQEPVDGRSREAFGHQLVEPGRVDVGADGD